MRQSCFIRWVYQVEVVIVFEIFVPMYALNFLIMILDSI